ERRRAVDGDPAAQSRCAVARAPGPGRTTGRDRTRVGSGRCYRLEGLARDGIRLAPRARRVRVAGTVRPPGDKSISHRALLVSALARGRSELTGLLSGDDVKSTARVLRQLGVEISSIRDGATVSVHASRLSHPASRLYCGNSGTTARLLLGVLAGQRFEARLTGDASLSRRPMRRVSEPLRAMGAEIREER